MAGSYLVAGPGPVPSLAGHDLAAASEWRPVAVAVEGCTGWRYVVEEIIAAGLSPIWPSRPTPRRPGAASATPRPTAATLGFCASCCRTGTCPNRGSRPRRCWSGGKRSACTSPCSTNAAVGPAHPRRALPARHRLPQGQIRYEKTRAALTDPALVMSAAGRQRIAVAYRMIDATTAESKPIKLELTNFGRRQPACRALVDSQYGIGGMIAVAVWSELGDCPRFSRSLQVVRHTGLDVTVDQSDRRRANGFLSRQGPETLRWALYEAAKNSSHAAAPDHDYYSSGETGTRRQARRHLHGPQDRPPLLSHPAQPRSRTGLRHTPNRAPRSSRRRRSGPPVSHIRVSRSKAPYTGVRASLRAGQP